MKRVETEAEVTSLAQSGEGIANVGGKRLLVPGTMPGDRVRLEIVKDRVVSVAIESPAPNRLAPPCAIVDACGGCTWQHVPPEMQRDARLEQLRRALPASLRSHAIEYVAADERYAYRTRARLAWSTRGGVKLGFRGRGTHDVIDLVACPVMVPALEAALAVLREEIAHVGGHGEIGLALGVEGRPVANIRPLEAIGTTGFAVIEHLVDRGFAGAAMWAPGATAPAIAGDPHPVSRGGDGEPLRLGLEGFAQANDALNIALAQHVAAESRPSGKTVLELFAGAGNFTVLLGRDATKVIAVESDDAAVAAMRANLAARGLGNVSAVVADAVAGLKKADVVVLDPPRTGAREVCEALAKQAPKRVVYVSCDAATLGRDLGILDRSMQLERLVVFEMFPQTPHLETVATLAKRRS